MYTYYSLICFIPSIMLPLPKMILTIFNVPYSYKCKKYLNYIYPPHPASAFPLE
jgi:hypothetical protein